MGLAIPVATNRAHATGLTGEVYINPPTINPTLPLGTIFNMTVQVSGMDYFTGWDVYVLTNPSVINPIKITFSGDLFEANYTAIPLETSNCVDGVPGIGCRGVDGPGVAHSAAAILSPPKSLVAPINGTLFTITYNVTSAATFSRIDVISSSSRFENGFLTSVPYTASPGIYGTQPPDFIISANPTRVNVLQGSNATTTISVGSLAGFKGAVNLTASKQFRAVFARSTLNITANGSNSTQLILIVPLNTLATDYPTVTITASNRTNSHSISVDVNVKTYSNFLLSISPTSLRIHAGDTANTTIILSSQNGFSGNVNLTLQVPANVSVAIGSSNVAVSANGISKTGLNVTVPVLSLPFLYTINVTAMASTISGGATFQLSQTQRLIITPPPPSFNITITPPRLVMRAGLTSSVVINVASVDYAWQYLYLSATMSGGEANLDNNTYYMPLPNTQYASTNESKNFTLTVQVPADQVSGPFGVILTVYQNSPKQSQNAPTQTIVIPVYVISLAHDLPTSKILGLSPLIYFGILGVLVIPFIGLSLYTYRKAREDQDEDWKS